MILTDMLELVGKNVRVILYNGSEAEGVLEYVSAYSQMYSWRKAKHFYCGDLVFRAHHVKEVIVL